MLRFPPQLPQPLPNDIEISAQMIILSIQEVEALHGGFIQSIYGKRIEGRKYARADRRQAAGTLDGGSISNPGMPASQHAQDIPQQAEGSSHYHRKQREKKEQEDGQQQVGNPFVAAVVGLRNAVLDIDGVEFTRRIF